ncbi:unnamed protein product [Oikopleura dioica]|uniref:Cysteine/serine-rich nuclear protein N-terminal domain-containing protein n=1 Tax=Oikopleura dioica TaxID=34765 RepID=E4XEC8_OIKDI|nr:unnamed protein product [Oikopleura dioica]
MAESPRPKIAKLSENNEENEINQQREPANEIPSVPENVSIINSAQAQSSKISNEKAAEGTLNDSGCHSGSSDHGQGSVEKELDKQGSSGTVVDNQKEGRTEKGILRRDKIKRKRPLRFSSVREFVFQRKQSFCTLPSTGGCALGMDEEHHDSESFPIPLHRERLHSKRRKKLRKWRAKQRKIAAQTESGQPLTSDLSSENDSDSDAPEEDLTGVDEWWFLQPIAAKKRRKILKNSIEEVDSMDRLNNRVLRSSREVCGCSCVDVCHPDTCECAEGGIPCQVDREGFPCPCQVGRCGNPSGRRSFNSARVRHHFFKTMYKLRCGESPSRQSPCSPSTSEVRTIQVQQPYSFGDFTKPSDFQGHSYLPQQWNQQTSLSEWTSVQQLEEESHFCDNLPSAEENPVILPNLEASSESSTEEGSIDSSTAEKTPQKLSQPASMNETNITVINEESSRDSDLTV